jgi:trypsin-like peptidase
MKSLLTKIAYFLLILAIFPACAMLTVRSDSYVRNRVVQLHLNGSSCSGVQVIAPSGKAYVLTAGHCRGLVEQGKVEATDEHNTKYYLDFIKEDPNSDLMLLSSPNDSGVSIAHNIYLHDHVHAMTHGKGFPTYRTDGEALSLNKTEFAEFEIKSLEDIAACLLPKNKISQEDASCRVLTVEMVATASIVPGSSGGPLLDDSGSLVGIASCTDGYFGSFVSLADIRKFMEKM